MRLLIYAIIIAGLVFLYFNRSYAYYYDYLGSHPLTNPNQTYYVFEGQGRENTLVYIALGDSLTAGIGASDHMKPFPVLIAQSLAKRYESVVLNNFGQPQATTADVLNSQINLAKTNISPAKNPHLTTVITIFIGINDLHNFESLNNFKKNYQEIISGLKTNNQAKIVLINLPYLGSKTLLPPFNYLVDYRTQKYNEAIKSLAEKNNLQLIDLYTSTQASMKNDQGLYSSDFFHPSDKGYQLWAQVIKNSL